MTLELVCGVNLSLSRILENLKKLFKLSHLKKTFSSGKKIFRRKVLTSILALFILFSLAKRGLHKNLGN